MAHVRTKNVLSAFAVGVLMAGAASAGTITPSFDVDPSSTSIDTTAPGYVDWGYFLPNADFLAGDQAAGTDFDDLKADYNAGDDTFAIDPATNSKAASGIGAVTITPRDVAEYSFGNTGNAWAFTVNDGIAPVSGTQNPLGAANGIAGGEDIFTITFNDLVPGTSTITLYMDHTNNGRTFAAGVDLTAADGNASQSITSAGIGGTDGEGYFTFTVEVVTTDPSADLAISIDSNSGSSGQFQFAGYTVFNPVPEPSSLAVLGLCGLLIARRRRG